MKISYRTHPVLKMLEEEKLGVIGFLEEDRLLVEDKNFQNYIKLNFYKYSKWYKKKIFHLSKTFLSNIQSSFHSLISDSVWNNIGSNYGTILNLSTPLGTLSAMYAVQGEKGSDTHDRFVYYFLKNVFVGVSAQGSKDLRSATYSVEAFNFIKNKIPNSNKMSNNDILLELDNQLNTSLIAHINFIKYAQVETKYLPAKKRIKDINCKYVNDTNSNITYLDSTWFTTLVKSDAFKVRGHFRLQPKKKDGEWTKELIWINEFQKDGYTAPARKMKDI